MRRTHRTARRGAGVGLVGLLLVVGTSMCRFPDASTGSGQGVVPTDSAALALATSDYSRDLAREELIGLRHPPYPTWIEDLAGATLRETRTAPYRFPWTVASVRVRGRPAVLLSRGVEWIVADGGGRYPLKEVVDVLPLPPLSPGERLVLPGCTNREGRPVIAYAWWDVDEPVVRDIRLTWRIDLERGALIEEDATGASCGNPRFGRE